MPRAARWAPGWSRLNTIPEWNKDDCILLEAGFAEGGVGFVDIVNLYAVGCGNAVERLALKHYVGKVNLTVQFYLFL